MIQKMLINEFLTLVPTYATFCPWFVCIFSRKSWYREVEGSFLSPFHDHFFIFVIAYYYEKTTKHTCTRTRNFFTENENGHETDLFKSKRRIEDMNLH